MTDFSIEIKKLIKSKLSTDVLLTFSVQLVIMICLFATNKILSNRLDVESFGLFNVVKKSVTVISFTMLSGVGIALPRYLALYIGQNNKVRAKAFIKASIYFVCGISIIVFGFGLIFKNSLSKLIVEEDNLSLYLLAFSYAAAMTISSLLFAYYRGISDFKKYNISQLVVQLALIIPIVTFSNLNLNSLILCWAIITILVSVVFIIIEKYNNRFTLIETNFFDIKQELKIVAKYSLPRLIGDFFLFTFSAFPLIYLKYNVDLKATAHYSIGIMLLTIVTPIFSILGTILLPYISEALAKKEYIKINKIISRLCIAYSVLAVLITVVMYYLVEWLIYIFFSPEYLVSKEISRILILSLLPQSMYLLFRNPIDAVSIFPYNTLILGLSLTAIVVLFVFCNNLHQYAWSYVFVSLLQGSASLLVWIFLKRKYKNC